MTIISRRDALLRQAIQLLKGGDDSQVPLSARLLLGQLYLQLNMTAEAQAEYEKARDGDDARISLVAKARLASMKVAALAAR